jgi:hypothetical protein
MEDSRKKQEALSTAASFSSSSENEDIALENNSSVHSGGGRFEYIINHRGKRRTSDEIEVIQIEQQQPVQDENGLHVVAIKRRTPCAIIFTIFVLLLELGAAMVAIMYWEDLMECCGDSFVSVSDSVTSSWNTALFAVAVGYLTWVIVQFPIIALTKEPVFLFNPMIGFLLAIHMLYVTNVLSAYIIYGLETAAMLGQSYILMNLGKSAELCIHSLFNFTMSGLVVYLIIELSKQGGYCIVDGELESVFQLPTCNIACTDEASCNVCTANTTSCFISFSQ